MNDNVIISIRGEQVNDNGPDEIELVTTGQLTRSENGYTVSYQESELTGLEGTTTVVRIEGDRITLLREGTVNSQMVFEVGRKHLSMYETPYGSLAMGINTSRTHSTITEQGGDLEIDYAIEVDNLTAGYSFFRMNVRPDHTIKQ